MSLVSDRLPCQRQRHGPHRAFTLIEVLVVLTIISVLAGLLWSSFGMIQRSFAQTTCIANLKSIGTAVHLFTLENNSYYPGIGSDRSENTRWFARLLPYMGYQPTTTWEGFPIVRHPYTFEEFLCPSRKLNPEIGGRYGFNTKMQSNVSASPHGMLGVRVSAVTDPVRTPMVADRFGANPTSNINGPFPIMVNGISANHRSDNNPRNGPDGKANYLFADGHTETRTTWIGAAAFELQ